jgi:hypothetical protein
VDDINQVLAKDEAVLAEWNPPNYGLSPDQQLHPGVQPSGAGVPGSQSVKYRGHTISVVYVAPKQFDVYVDDIPRICRNSPAECVRDARKIIDAKSGAPNRPNRPVGEAEVPPPPIKKSNWLQKIGKHLTKNLQPGTFIRNQTGIGDKISPEEIAKAKARAKRLTP